VWTTATSGACIERLSLAGSRDGGFDQVEKGRDTLLGDFEEDGVSFTTK
jgi:hypothetical protein